MKLNSVTVTTGFLEACPLEFAQELTCIIGARGTCKSTVVELMRFAFDVGPGRIRTMLESPAPGSQAPSHAGLLKAALAGGTVRCRVLLEDATEAIVERAMDGSPRVVRDGVEVSDVDLSTLGLEVYSQGELQQVVEDSSRRLALVDRAHRGELEALLESRAAATIELRAIGPRLRQLRAEIDALEQRTKLLPKYRGELAALEAGRAPVPPAVEAEREKSAQRRGRREMMDSFERLRGEILATLREVASRKEHAIALAEKLSIDADAKPFVLAMDPVLAAINTSSASALLLAGIDVGPILAGIADADNAGEERYRRLREQQREMTESLRAEDTLRREVEQLTAIDTRRRELEWDRDGLLARREELRSSIQVIADQMYALRVSQIEKINLEFEGMVLLTLQQGAASLAHRRAIEHLLEGSRLRSQSDVAGELAERVPAGDLVDIVETGDAQRLASVLGRDPAQMTRLIGHVIDRAELYELEGTSLDDWLEITLYVDGVPKPLSQLSKGQMATALLPLVLRAGAGPVIFDQPEDDLDNAFIFRMLVPRIRALKGARQLIFVTHNANIPVLGDAERVVVMSMAGATRAAAAGGGSVDEMRGPILGLLEGGPDAFKRRGERYGDLLPVSI